MRAARADRQRSLPAGAPGTPYLLTLGGHDAFWFDLGPRRPDPTEAAPGVSPRSVVYDGAFPRLLLRGSALEPLLVKYLPTRRWFRSKSRRITSASLIDSAALGASENELYLVFVEVAFSEETPKSTCCRRGS